MNLNFDSEGCSFEGKLTLNGKVINICLLGNNNVMNLTQEEYENTVGGLIVQSLFDPIFRAVQAWAKISVEDRDNMWSRLEPAQKLLALETLNISEKEI
jgi:hypothetical protein